MAAFNDPEKHLRHLKKQIQEQLMKLDACLLKRFQNTLRDFQCPATVAGRRWSKSTSSPTATAVQNWMIVAIPDMKKRPDS